MQRKTVQVRWPNGLHLRPAAHLVRLGQRFRSSIWLCAGTRRADVRSLLALVSLCVMMGGSVDVVASGEDEDRAVQVIAQFIDSGGDEPVADREASR